MSKNFGVNLNCDTPPTQTESSSYSNLVENHVCDLMNELFHDLDGSSEPLKHQSSASSTQSGSFAASQLALAVKTNELQDNLLIPYVEMDAILEPYYAVEPAPESEEPSLGSFVLPGLAWGVFLGSASLFAFTQFNSFTRSPAAIRAAVPAAAVAQPQDIAFATEVSETLQSTENVLPPPSALAVTALPTIPVAAAAANSPAAASVPFAAQPPIPSLTSPVMETTQKKTQAFKLAKSLKTTKLQQPQAAIALPALSNRLPVLNGNQTQIAAAAAAKSYIPPALPSSLAPQALPMGRQAKSGVTINTILDLGSKSAILISRNGSTQNVRPGEVVDSTGWVFVQVKNGQAILERGNETRTVGIGEQF
jgi:hypothetical protein